MYTQQFYMLNSIMMAVDAVIVIVTGYYAYWMSLEFRGSGMIMGFYDLLLLLGMMMFGVNYFMGRFGFYSSKRFSSMGAMIGALLPAVLSAFIVMVTCAVLLGIRPFSRVYLISHFAGVLILFVIIRIILYLYLEHRARTPLNSRQILLVGSHQRALAVADALDKQQSWGHQIVGYLNGQENSELGPKHIPALGTVADFDQVLVDHEVDEVVFALPQGSPLKLDRYLKKCRDLGVDVRIVPALFNPETPSLRVETLQGIPTLTDSETLSSAAALFYKKILDMIGGSFGFLVFLFLYPIIGAAIKLDSPGPVLFKQVRLGMHGRKFNLYKFRSMGLDAEEKKTELLVDKDTPWPEYTTENDPRLTRVGRFLRKTSLDELPQFINVMKGEMSLVGTRPPLPEEVKHYEDWHRRRISIKPGVTGLWQISGRKEVTDFMDVVKLDLEYIDGWRFRRDLWILLKTLWVVLAGKGAK